MRAWLAGALIAASVAATAAGPVPVTIPSRDRDPATGAPLQLGALLFLPPATPGVRVPAVVALHGCGGMYGTARGSRNDLSIRHRRMAELLVADGYAVLFPDSFRARGRAQVCTVAALERTITPTTRRLDALDALAYLQGRDDVLPDRIAVLGWSHGGSTTLATMDARAPVVAAARAAGGPPYFHAAIAYYPGCRAALGTRGGYVPAAPLLLLVGSDDDWTAPEPCVDLVTRLRDAGVPATLALYADAAHGFDGPDGDRRHLDVPGGVHPGQGVTVASHPAARDDSYARVRAFLRAELRAAAGARSQEE